MAEFNQMFVLARWVPLLLLQATPPASPTPRGPLHASEIVSLLHAGVTTARVRALVAQFGVDFEVTQERKDMLQAAGADEGLLRVVEAGAPRPSPPPASPLPKATPRTPVPAPVRETAAPPRIKPTGSEPGMITLPDQGGLAMGRYEVTNRQFRAFCQSSGRPMPDPPFWGTPDELPVVNVTWNDAVSFCRWLTLTVHRNYRLPTEAEWEHAARGGRARTAFPWGDDDPNGRSCFSRDAPCPVGSYRPNGYGLYDLAGNVAEWCQDSAGGSDQMKAVRGGSWQTPARNPELLRIDRRDRLDAQRFRNDVGFRVVRTP